MKRLSEKNKLVKRYLEHRPKQEYQAALGRKRRGRGIYVLYRDQKIYYIGLSRSSLRSRLRAHATRDRHKGRWNNFSFYQIGRKKYIKDIESLMLRIICPPGNKVGGRFQKRYNLNNKLSG